MAKNSTQSIRNILSDTGSLIKVDDSGPPPSLKDMLIGGGVLSIISVILVAVPLLSGTFHGDTSDQFLGSFLVVFALVIESLVIYGISSTIKKKSRLRRSHLSGTARRTD
jgi:hypothetical protein